MMRLALVLLLLAAGAPAEDDRVAVRVRDPALRERIHAAIDSGVAFLKGIQHPAGHWAMSDRRGSGGTEKDLKKLGDLSHHGGYTALALYALAASRVPADDPAIVRGLAWIEKHARAYTGGGSAATYANSLLVLALTRIDPKAHRDLIHRTAKKIEQGALSSGFWAYTLGAETDPAKRDFGNPDRRAMNKGLAPVGRPDNSNTQFAVLALWAAQSIAGYPVKESTWKSVGKHFDKGQQDSGGWAYSNRRNDAASPTMTAAGIVSLVYAQVARDGSPRALELARRHVAVQKGLVALKRMMTRGSAREPSGLAGWTNYYMVYSLERVGTVLALDPEDWYVEGARRLVAQQGEDGAWSADPRATRRHYDTALALLFLTRATYPPVKGAVTPPEEIRTKAATTTRETFPDVTNERGLARAFQQYTLFKPEQRAAVLGEFGKAGPDAIGLFIRNLKDPREPVRQAAFELLTRLLDKPLLFEPSAGPEDRAVMLGPIEGFFRSRGGELRWDPAKRRFVLPSARKGN